MHCKLKLYGGLKRTHIHCKIKLYWVYKDATVLASQNYMGCKKNPHSLLVKILEGKKAAHSCKSKLHGK